jgi:hypothetical protein
MKTAKSVALRAACIVFFGMLAAAAGCGNGSSNNDVIEDVSALDANQQDVTGDTGEDTTVGDTSDDTAVGDTPTDANRPDVDVDATVISDGTGDTPIDSTGDVSTDANVPDADVTQDECRTSQDCEGCSFCLNEDGVKRCVTPAKMEAPECYDLVECDFGNECHLAIFGRPECGGYCSPTGTHTLHEWGVNTVTMDGDGTPQAGPVKYYESMDRKPVIYIYSDDQFTLDLGVRYDAGTSVETWPVIPDSSDVIWQGIQVGTTECTPTTTPAPDYTGETPAQEVWELPTWVVPGANCLTYGGTISKLLFYAGPFENYEPGVEAQVTRIDTLAGSVAVTNNLADTIGPVIVLYREAESACQYFNSCPVHTATVGWKVIESVAPGDAGRVTEDLEWDTVHVDATTEDPYPSVDGLLPAGWTELPAALRTALITKGLTADEADRFMTAWTDTMFGLHGADSDPWFPAYADGAFVIYLWPDSRTNEKLPLTAVPAPTSQVRAMVEYQAIQTVELL